MVKLVRFFFIVIFLIFGVYQVKGNIFVVTSDADNGPGTLRQAITDANSNVGLDSIYFNMPGSVFEILLLTSLPDITEGLFIDGSTQPGSSLPANPVTLGTFGFLDHGFELRTGNIQISNLKFTNIPTNPPNSYSGAIRSYSSGTSYGNFENIVINNNIFTNNSAGIIFYNVDSLSNIRIQNNTFSGNLASVSCAGFTGLEVVSDFQFTGNSCSDTSGLWLNFRKITSLLVDSNFFSDSNRDVTVYANRLNDSYITNNFFSNYSPMNQAIHVDAIRARNLFITQNEFHGYESSIELYCHGNSYTIEQNNILINQNNFYDVQNYAILLLYTHQIVPSSFVKNVEIAYNTIHSGISPHYGIWVYSWDDVELTNFNIHHNILHPSGFTYGIWMYLADKTTITGMNISDNVIEDSMNGIYLNSNGTNSTTNNKITFKDFSIKRNTISDSDYIGIKLAGYSSFAPYPFFLNCEIDSNTVINCGTDAINLKVYNLNTQIVFDSISINYNFLQSNGRSGIYMDLAACYASHINYTENSIYNNGALGIDLFQDSLIYGSPYVPAPIIDSVITTTGIITVYGKLNSIWPNRDFKIELFSNTLPDITGFGEGEIFFISDTINSGPGGVGQFSISAPTVPSGNYISAIATDLIVECTSVFSNTVGNNFTGTPELIENDFHIFPNPTSGKLNVSGVPPNCDLLIFNLQGAVVYINSIKSDSEWFDNTLPEGLYFYQIRKNMQVLHYGKLMKIGKND